MKRKFWKSDWFLGLLISLVVFGASGSGLLQGIEHGFGQRVVLVRPVHGQPDHAAIAHHLDQRFGRLGNCGHG